MGAQTETRIRDGVAHVVLDAGPTARLTASVLSALQDALSKLETDETIDLVVLSGTASGFPSGITTPSGGGDDRSNLLADVCLTIETHPKPVMAVLTGAVVGGGAELALAAHYRLAHNAARIGFPNARLGQVPNAGATQRLPRLAGAGVALDLLLGGQLLPLTSDRLSPLVDQIFDGTIDHAIRQFVAPLDGHPAKLRPTANLRSGFSDTAAFQAAIAKARKDPATSSEVAHQKIIAAVEASIVLPMAAGLAFEEAAAEDCAETDQARALAHLFHAEQAVAATTRRADLPPLDTVGVLGGGPHATQIVMTALTSGLRVNWLIRNPDQQRDSVGYLQALLQDAVVHGRFSPDRAKTYQSALRYGAAPDTLAGSDIILRAARGQRGLDLPAEVPVAHCLPGTDPRVLLNFAFPVITAPLAEIGFGPDSTDTDQRTTLALMQRMSKLASVQKTDGPVLSERLKSVLWRAADALVDLGQSPYFIDAALRDWGMAHPPFELADLSGLAVVARQDRAPGCKNWSARLVEAGRDGKPSHLGVYQYDDAGLASPDPDVTQILNTARAPQSDMPPAVIIRLIIGALANEGAKMLRDQMVTRAGDIDTVSVFTRLVPRSCGGVMHAAGIDGLLQTVQAMDALDHPDTPLWTPDPVFRELIKYGRRFDDL
ncbi:enoyl-CoA hydratase-related protein [Marivita sp. S6314]|uniref:enoyl-CoA hydratase/isomerase family protein n=1 Tax=Marivita sp. S6314 TaxID=2926406 RepID=UPI001FF3DC79|nr:enoyl-CoA hydratase/isomerase family protein [Marivita sp. S6314]MCK0149192.1 enoyl-CoA hydratase-related protein [Marivita sp. S6314]